MKIHQALCVEVNLTGVMIHAQIEHQKVKLSEIGKGRVSKICAMQHCLCMKVHLSHDIGPSCLHSAVVDKDRKWSAQTTHLYQ